mmetsp:Transcript_20166/g.57226  ORF Transcript_20166/g.57226 Transcript_20166/m.57226 type:complete len:363 (+) Transcript_20166:1863-2951(+)
MLLRLLFGSIIVVFVLSTCLRGFHCLKRLDGLVAGAIAIDSTVKDIPGSTQIAFIGFVNARRGNISSNSHDTCGSDSNESFRSKLDGVGKHIQDDLPQSIWITEQLHRNAPCSFPFCTCRIHAKIDLQMLVFSLRGDGSDRTLEYVLDLERNCFELHLASFQFGKVQQIVDDCHESMGARLEHINKVSLFLIQRCRCQKLDESNDLVKRRPDLVSHDSKEFALLNILAIGLLLCRLHDGGNVTCAEYQYRLRCDGIFDSADLDAEPFRSLVPGHQLRFDADIVAKIGTDFIQHLPPFVLIHELLHKIAFFCIFIMVPCLTSSTVVSRPVTSSGLATVAILRSRCSVNATLSSFIVAVVVSAR